MSNSIRKIGSSVSASACVHSEQSPFQIPPRHESEQFVLCHEVPIGKQYRLTNNTVDFLDFFLLSGEAERIAEMATATNIQHNCENHRPLDRRRRRMSAAAARKRSPSPPLPPPFTARALTTTLVSQSARRRRSMKTTTTLCGIEGEIGDQFKTVKRNEKKESVAVSPSKRLF